MADTIDIDPFRMPDTGTDPAPEDSASSELDDADLFRKLKVWYRKDHEHCIDWIEEAREDYAFVAGEQWSDKDRKALEEKNRPVITFNRVDPLIRAVAGEQINNAQEVRYMPREEGDVKANELLTSAAEWFRDQCDADDEESDMFWDSATCGMGWTDSILDMDTAPEEPMPVIERIDPLEMLWDADARKRNLSDARRIWRVRTMARDVAKTMFPDAGASDLNASWALLGDDGSARIRDQTQDLKYEADGLGDDDDDEADGDDEVTIVQCQWWEMESYYKVADPMPDPMAGMPSGKTLEMTPDEFERITGRLKQLAMPAPQAVKLSRRIYRQAFLGRVVLKVAPTPCPDHFSFNCTTGFRDRNKGTFYGLVRAMKDPQRWANKWLSQTLHIMNTTAKGGVMAEEDAVEDWNKFEKSYAKSDVVTKVNAGALQRNAIQPKEVATFPQGFFQLMEFAISSVRDVAGINLEMIGMREADQAASLEYQRRQAGVTILAQLFRSMRRYHRNQGKVLLYYIQNYLSDGRLVKIVGQGLARYVPLIKQADVKYDIIVDEGPSSPNQKERVWALVGERFWTLPPEIQLALLEYSPFPSSVIEKVKAAAQQASQSPQAQMQQRLTMLEATLTEVKASLAQAQANQANANAQKTMSEIGQGEAAPDNSPAVLDHIQRANEAETKAHIDTTKIAADVLVKREKIASDAQVNREWMATDAEAKARSDAIAAATAIRKQAMANSMPQPGHSHRP